MKCRHCNSIIDNHIELELDGLVFNFCNEKCMTEFISNHKVNKTKDDIRKMVVEFQQVRFVVSYKLNNNIIEIISLNDQDGNKWNKNTIGNYLDSKRHIVFDDDELKRKIVSNV